MIQLLQGGAPESPKDVVEVGIDLFPHCLFTGF